MIRKRLKSAVRGAALKFFNMEFDAEERKPATPSSTNPADFDESKIPKIVDGSGDTPGPKHKTDIGRTWLAAQVVSNSATVLVDIRPLPEVAGGFLPGAIFMPGETLKSNLGVLPDKGTRITIYDQTGELGSSELAAWLREQGWEVARRLAGGYAEWLEHSEPILTPATPQGAKRKVTDQVKLPDGRTGYIQNAVASPQGIRYTIWLEDGQLVGPLDEDAISA